MVRIETIAKIPRTSATSLRTDAHDKAIVLAERKRIRQKEAARRAKIVKYWKQRDPTRIPELVAEWKATDREARRRSRIQPVELSCELCNRPFSKFRKPSPQQQVLCPVCAREMRIRKERRYREAHPESVERDRENKRKKKLAPVAVKPIPEPTVVWSPTS